MVLLSLPVTIYMPYGINSELTLSNPVVGEAGFSSPVVTPGIYTLGAAYSSVGSVKSYWMVSLGRGKYTVFVKGDVYMDSSEMLNAAGEDVGTMSAGSYSAGVGTSLRFPFGSFGLSLSYYGTWIAHSSSGTAVIDLGFNKDIPSIGLRAGLSVSGISAPFSYFEDGESYIGLPSVSLGALKSFSGLKGMKIEAGATLGYEGTFKGGAFASVNYSGADILFGAGWKDGLLLGVRAAYSSVSAGILYDPELGSTYMFQLGGKF